MAPTSAASAERRQETTIYSADITAGSLRLPESRVIARLLLDGVDDDGWQDAIYGRNALQARSPATAKRLTRLIRNRLETMDEDLWNLVVDGSSREATHGVLAAAVKHSRLLGDFLDQTVRDAHRMRRGELALSDWEEFLRNCEAREEAVAGWSESTRRKLQTTIFFILQQAEYIDTARRRRLQLAHVEQSVLDYLRGRGEDYVLRCVQIPS
jgi:hypothetical protein